MSDEGLQQARASAKRPQGSLMQYKQKHDGKDGYDDDSNGSRIVFRQREGEDHRNENGRELQTCEEVAAPGWHGFPPRAAHRAAGHTLRVDCECRVPSIPSHNYLSRLRRLSVTYERPENRALSLPRYY